MTNRLSYRPDGGINFSESITGLLKCLQIRALSFTRGHLFVLAQTRIYRLSVVFTSSPLLATVFLHHFSIWPELVFLTLLRRSGIGSQPDGPVQKPCLTYKHARLHKLAESVPWASKTCLNTDTGKVCHWYPFLKVRLSPFLPITFCM